jgi:NAD(P)-dependent dehydrogenase (short-subunit alcohol dehydrogenase family)
MIIEGSTPLVTGGNRGIGEAFVRAFLAAGAEKVYVGTRIVEAADHLVDEDPNRVVAVELDVTRAEQVEAAVAACSDVNILVNNAGVFANQRLIGSDSMAAAREEMEVNYFGTLSMCRAFAPILAQNGGGAIANILSSAAIVSVPVMGGYSPSKFASRALTTSVRAELAGQGTEVNCLIVGSVDTRMASHVEGKKEAPADIAKAGLRAIAEYSREIDTDAFAEGIRAGLAKAPDKLERNLARMLDEERVSTGRS